MLRGKVKVKVGQVWTSDALIKHTITSINGRDVYAKRENAPEATFFGYINKDGFPEAGSNWEKNWYLDCSHIKIKVGQVWREGDHTVTISRIDYKNQKCFFIENGIEALFGHLNKNGMPDRWLGWFLEKEAPGYDMVAFFKAVPDGYCPCNIAREICDYHK